MSLKLVALRTAVILGIVLVALALWQMREAAQLLAVAIATSAGLAPLVERLSARGWPRPRAAAAVFGGVLLTMGALGVGLSVLLAFDLDQMASLLPLWYSRGRRALEVGAAWAPGLAEALPASVSISEILIGSGAALLSISLRGLALAALTLGTAALGFYWLVGEQRITRLWLSLLPVGARTRVRALGTAVYSEVGTYVRGVATVVLLTMAALLLIFKLAGLPGAAILAVIGGVSQIVPLLGPALALAPVAAVTLAQGGVAATAGLAAAIVAVAAIRLLVAPRLIRRGISVNPVLVVVLIMALADLGGLPLILLAPPLAAALQAATRALVETGRSEASRTRAVQVEDLAGRLDEVATSATESPEAQRIQALVERARTLLTEAQRTA
ncbi:MAG: AI-2E family transporter [Chloroflexales bacterium]|nr:AI-2E family transporter [Chloroflexales bacterium]